MRKKELYVFLIFLILLLPVAYFNSIADFDGKIQFSEQDIKNSVKNVDLIGDLLADMPALHGSIEFQSYGQVDVIIDKLMAEDKIIKTFYVLDSKLNVLHLKQSSYGSDEVQNQSFAEWGMNSPYVKYKDDVFILKKVEPNQSSNKFFIMFRLSLREIFNRKLVESGIHGVSLKPFLKAQSVEKFNLDKVISGTARIDFFFTYLARNLFGIVVIIVLISLGFILVLRWLINPFREITFYLQNLTNKSIGQVELRKYPRVFKPFIVNIIEANRTIINSQQRERDAVIQQSKFKVAQQVAHDIRSPLGVLKTIRPEINILSEDVRRIIQLSLNRIEEITLNLLKMNENGEVVEKEVKEEELLSLLENVLIEKRIEYRNIPDLEINDTFNSKSYGLFSYVSRSFLKRIISNMINNSVEATGRESCSIEVSLFQQMEWNVIKVKDNGTGIAEANMPKLFQKGFTTKISGNGLGLSSAKEELEKVGGRIEILSLSREGTVVNIFLPRVVPSLLFVRSIDIYNYNKIIILDDDSSIHELWNKKFRGSDIVVEHFYSSKEFLCQYENLNESTLLLSDFELIGDSLDGLDVIERFKHCKHSILVTARSEELEIQERCIDLSISCMSKTLINYISLRKIKPRAILIDDDKLSHWRWKDFCKEKGITLRQYFSIDEFVIMSDGIERGDIIFLDSDLGNGVKGEIDGESIHKLGFNNIYISTNYSRDSFTKPSWIKGVLSKNPIEAFNEIEFPKTKILSGI